MQPTFNGKKSKMNIYDAAKILNITGDATPEIIKKAYWAACRKYHPDLNPAGGEMMKLINAAYDVLKDYQGHIKEQQTDYSEKVSDALNAVFGNPDLIIELCGAWVWITGNTKAHRETLKSAGFKWSAKKEAWYFRPEEYRSRSKGSVTLEEIREKYGSTRPMGAGRRALQRGAA